MNKKLRTILVVVVSVIAVAVLTHLTKSYFIPFIVNMHSGGGY